MAPTQMSVTASNFYRRPLPESCTDFASPDGKRLFTEALGSGAANIFFKLSSQFRTQDDPAFCGLSSLVMVLNALEVDPGKVWRAPWRFYHESMLDCCVPVENVKRVGLTLPQVSCLAACNRLDSKMRHAEKTEESVRLFRSDVVASVQSDDVVLLASYDRGTLGQTGSGHFSPVAAFHAGEDKVLILDVARFKYPPHWVDLSLLHDAMCTPDLATSKNRGYLNLSLVPNTRPLLKFGLRASIASTEPQFASSKESWTKFLAEEPLPNPEEEMALCCRRFSQYFSSFALCCKSNESCGKNCPSEMEAIQSEAVQSLCGELRRTTPARLLLSSSVAALLFAWTFEQPPPSERARRLEEMLTEERKIFSPDTVNEIALLKKQLEMISCGCKLPLNLDPK